MNKSRWLKIIYLTLIFTFGCSSSKLPLESTPKVQTPALIPSAIPVSEVTKLPTEESVPVTVTPEINPFEGKIWDQYCDLIKEGGMIVAVHCDEKWSLEPLPGGCDSKSLDFKGYSGCTAAALAYVINTMLSPKEIEEISGEGTLGVTPSYIIDEVYPIVGIRLGCNGTTVPTIRDTLAHYGLFTRSKAVDKINLQKSIRPYEMAIVGIKMKYKGLWIEHWSVPVDFANGEIIFADSYVGKGSRIIFNQDAGIESWEIISILYVSKTPY